MTANASPKGASLAPDKCFACGRKMAHPESVFTEDRMSDGKQYEVYIGPECFKHVIAAGEAGYQPPLGGPRLFSHAKAVQP